VNTPIKSYSLDASNNNINYNTVRECGVYIYFSYSSFFYMYPLLYSNSDMYSNLFNVFNVSGAFTSTNAIGVNNTAAIGNYDKFDMVTSQAAGAGYMYLVYPSYGIKMYDSAATLLLNYYNNTTTPAVVSQLLIYPGTPQGGKIVKIYYNGVEQVR
jgi:hypothetical protein